jgi:GGDEF domain-containing protein
VQDEVERAKRFNLGLSLVVIDPNDVAEDGESPVETVVKAVRPELRASDLLGRVRGGAIAVLLVHAGPEGARSVASRLGHRLAGVVDETQRAAVRLGQAVFSSDCQSGDALIRQALQRMEQLNAGG